MKVKVGQLKAGLSQYLREIQESGEALEVCVRETSVAYLTPIGQKVSDEIEERRELEQRLESRGIRIVSWGRNVGKLPQPGKAGDGKELPNPIVAIRKEKDW